SQNFQESNIELTCGVIQFCAMTPSNAGITEAAPHNRIVIDSRENLRQLAGGIYTNATNSQMLGQRLRHPGINDRYTKGRNLHGNHLECRILHHRNHEAHSADLLHEISPGHKRPDDIDVKLYVILWLVLTDTKELHAWQCFPNFGNPLRSRVIQKVVV